MEPRKNIFILVPAAEDKRIETARAELLGQKPDAAKVVSAVRNMRRVHVNTLVENHRREVQLWRKRKREQMTKVQFIRTLIALALDTYDTPEKLRAAIEATNLEAGE